MMKVKGLLALLAVMLYLIITSAADEVVVGATGINAQGRVIGSVSILGANYTGKQKTVLKVTLADGTVIASVETTVDFQKIVPNPCPCSSPEPDSLPSPSQLPSDAILIVPESIEPRSNQAAV